jgi:hypothetical protein
MIYLLPVAAWVQTLWENGTALLDRMRRQILVPLVLTGRRDMVMLTNGQWIDDPRGGIPDSAVRYFYDAEKHTVRSAGDTVRVQRWPWLTLTTDRDDFTDFITGLRAGTGVRPAAVLTLLACQKRVAPAGRMHVTLRDGTDIMVTENGEPVPTDVDGTAGVNHIQ